MRRVRRMTARVLGLDLSIAATGVAAGDQLFTIRGKPADGDRRLQVIRNTVQAICIEERIELTVVEDLPFHAKAAGVTGMVQGAVRTILLDLDVPYVTVPPATLKIYATGKGNATKPDIRMALYQRADLDIRDDNQADAWWLRALGMDYLGCAPLQLPVTHRRALDKLTWPAGLKAAA
jgi:Holliday junction resolvasome RuvABC endonuclease subunit